MEPPKSISLEEQKQINLNKAESNLSLTETLLDINSKGKKLKERVEYLEKYFDS